MCLVVHTKKHCQTQKWLAKVSCTSFNIPKISSARLKFQKALLIAVINPFKKLLSFLLFQFVNSCLMYILKTTDINEVCQWNTDTMPVFVVTCETVLYPNKSRKCLQTLAVTEIKTRCAIPFSFVTFAHLFNGVFYFTI